MTQEERLDALRGMTEGGRWTDLARLLELKTAQQFTDIRAGKHSISTKMAQKIAEKFPGISWEWMFNGTGPMFNKKSEAGATVALLDACRSEDIPHVKVDELELGAFYPEADLAVCGLGEAMKEYPEDAVLVLRRMEENAILIPGTPYVFHMGEVVVCRRYQQGGEGTMTLYASSEKRHPDGRLVYEPLTVERDRVSEVYSVLGWLVPSRVPTNKK